MGFKCGIVGLPNVGKSTLFNALTQTAAAEAANYPFCTIEPNVGDVGVPDPRLDRLAEIAKSAAVVPTRLTFVDIAGLVRGASKGEGLGNQFLAHIREVDAVAYVLRCFEDDGRHPRRGPHRPDRRRRDGRDRADAGRPRQPGAPARAAGEEGAGRRQGGQGAARPDRQGAGAGARRQARAARAASSAEEDRLWRQMQLLTAKPVLYVCNVDEASIAGNALTRKVAERAKAEGAGCVVISAKIEAELAGLEPEERAEYLQHLGLQGARPQRARSARATASSTSSPSSRPAPRRRAPGRWRPAPRRRRPPAPSTPTSRRASSAPRPSPTTTTSASAARSAAKEAGKMRLEGKEYVVKDGDVMLFRFAT